MTSGTEIVFEYSVPEESLDEENRHYLADVQGRSRGARRTVAQLL